MIFTDSIEPRDSSPDDFDLPPLPTAEDVPRGRRDNVVMGGLQAARAALRNDNEPLPNVDINIDEIEDVLENLDSIPITGIMSAADDLEPAQRCDAAIFTRRVIRARRLIRIARESIDGARAQLNRALDVSDWVVTEDP